MSIDWAFVDNPIHPTPSYHPGTFVASAPFPGHVNHIAPATLTDQEHTFHVDLNHDGLLPTPPDSIAAPAF